VRYLHPITDTEWYQIGWHGWAGVVGTIATLAGLAWTVQQVRLAKRAAEHAESAAKAAKVASEAAWDRLNALHLQAAAPLLRGTADAIDRAVDADDRDRVKEHLREWRSRSAKVQGLLVATGDNVRATRLTECNGMVRQALSELDRLPRKTLRTVVRIARANIHQIVDDFDSFAMAATMTSEDPHDGQ
jgi:hypothetical protein